MITKDLFNIGTVSKMFNVSIKTLHHYDKIGLLKPTYIDKNTKYRYYSSTQFLTLYVIKELKHQGFSLPDIQKLLQNNDLEKLKNIYLNKKIEIENEIKNLKKLDNRISVKLNQIEKIFEYLTKKDLNSTKDKKFFLPMEIKHFEKRTIITIRRKSPFNFFAVAVRTIELFNLFEKYNLQMVEPYIIIFHDNYKNINPFFADYEICACLEKESLTDENIYNELLSNNNIRELDEGDFLLTTSAGSFEESFYVYDEMIKWIVENNYEICGPVYKYYIANYALTKSVENIVYELHIPVKSKSN